MLNQYSNLRFLHFLNFYDLINKFNYNNFYLIPIFTKIEFKIFIKGILDINFLNIYLKNFLLLFLFCFNNLNTNLQFKKSSRRKQKSYKIKLFISYSFLKKKIANILFNLFFFFKKFIRPFFFSNHLKYLSNFSGKYTYSYSKIITFIPSLMLLDHKEHRFFPFFKKSKIFLTLTLKIFITKPFFNFFVKIEKPTKSILKNFLLVWLLI